MTIGTRERALLGVIAAIALLAGFYVLALKPQMRSAAQLNRSIVAAQRSLATAQDGYSSGRSAQARLRTSDAEYTAAQRAVPGTPDIPALLKLLQRAADSAHVSIDSINLSGTGSGTTSAAPATATATTGANTIPVALTFGGGYRALARMVSKLDDLVTISHGQLRASGPLVGIGSVSLAPSSSTGSDGTTASELTVQLSATIYQSAAATTASGSTSGATS